MKHHKERLPSKGSENTCNDTSNNEKGLLTIYRVPDMVLNLFKIYFVLLAIKQLYEVDATIILFHR